MPRSKLALGVPIKKLFTKEKLNPTLELLRLYKEVDEKGKPVLDAKTRATIMLKLAEYQYSKPKTHEPVTTESRTIEFINQTFTLPPPANGTTIATIRPPDEDLPAA